MNDLTPEQNERVILGKLKPTWKQMKERIEARGKRRLGKPDPVQEVINQMLEKYNGES